MHANVVADPDAVVIEIVCTPVTPLTMLCVLENVCIAYVTIELIICRVEFKLGEAITLGCSGQSFQGNGGISRVAPGNLCRQNNHH